MFRNPPKYALSFPLQRVILSFAANATKAIANFDYTEAAKFRRDRIQKAGRKHITDSYLGLNKFLDMT